MASQPKEDDPVPANEGAHSFAVFLTHVGDGDINREVSEELHELLGKVREQAHETGAATGSLTLKFTFKAEKKGSVKITHDVTTKAPKKLRASGAMWLTAGGNLSSKNPRQQTLKLREAGDTGAARELDTPTAPKTREA